MASKQKTDSTDPIFDKKIYKSLMSSNRFNEVLIAVLYTFYCMFFGSYMNVEGYMSELNLSILNAIRHLNKISSTHDNVTAFFIGGMIIYGMFYCFHKQLIMLGLSVRRLMKGSKKDDKEGLLIEKMAEFKEALEMQFVPEIYVSTVAAPNAFASGYNEKSSFIVFSKGLMTLLSPQELVAILAQQMCHIKLKNIKLTLAVSLASNGPILFFDVVFYKLLYKSGNKFDNSWFLSKIIFLLKIYRFFLPILNILYRYILTGSRVNVANKLAIESLIDKKDLESALAKIKQYHDENKDAVGKIYQDISYDKVRREMYVIDAGAYNYVQTIATPFVVQPSIDEQIDTLDRMEKADNEIAFS